MKCILTKFFGGVRHAPRTNQLQFGVNPVGVAGPISASIEVVSTCIFVIYSYLYLFIYSFIYLCLLMN